ncbi:MAG: type II secretion system minor pseudopilin GspH [Candidatus Sedimenticola sp. (ex Thyasira tokunagai)]
MIAKQNGFTLIELLVVVFIIGMISGVAVLSVGSAGGDHRLETEAQRMGRTFSLAAQEAILQGRPTGVMLNSKGYSFLMAGKDKWGALEDEALLASQTLPGDWQLELTAGGYPKLSPSEAGEKEKGVPQIIFFPSGQISPFELQLSDSTTDIDYRLIGLASGRLKLQAGEGNL